MATYAIGDIQGCLDSLLQLLEQIKFDKQKDRLWFTGDLVNRGPQSLETLRFVKQLGNKAMTVLGNHDLHLLMVAGGFSKLRPDDTLDSILNAPDRHELLDWLRHQRMMFAENNVALVHAGLLPQWDLKQALALAQEVEEALRDANYGNFLQQLYGSQPQYWNDSWVGYERLRVIVNAMTRMRFCTSQGVMEFHTKGGLDKTPSGYLPWFDVPERKTKGVTLITGHWSALGLVKRNNLIALDTGCVWGGELTAIRLEDLSVFQVACAQAATPRNGQ